jgi:hypothetical protein
VGAGRPVESLPDEYLTRRIEVVGDAEELGNRHLLVAMKFKFGI